ncbi:hypothetical protein K0L99_002406 [Escherichia coli]|nr:hypothetical protein [Escherichia coli]
MRILKCYLANNSRGRFVTAEEAACGKAETWICLSCGCVLVLHAAHTGEAPWFEHDQGSVSVGVLMRCTHLDPEVKAQARRRKLCRIVDELNAPVIVLSWYCVWCGNHYQGKKHCVVCGTGLYSTEAYTRQMNDTRTSV